MKEQTAREWRDPTANEAIRKADLSILEDKIAKIEARLRANGSRARNRTLRKLMGERKRIIYGNGRLEN